jgi:hypothetical protein
MIRRDIKPPSVWPPITDGLTFYAPLKRDFGTVPVFSAAGTTGLSTETVDADGTYEEDFSNLIVGASANTARITPNGMLSEVASTNHALYSADMSNAAWVKSNMAVDSDSHIDPSGNANTTCELRATAGNATILQTVTIASAAFRYAVYLKRKTGSGNVDITIDNGGTWATKTINSTSWTRVDVGKTAANPIFGIRIVTSGDEVLATFNQMEPQAAPTSYIPTEAASVTRSADVFTYPSSGNIAASAGTVIAHTVPISDATGRSANGQLFSTFAGGDADGVLVNVTSANVAQLLVKSGNSTVANLSGLEVISESTGAVVAAAWAANDFRLYTDGGDEQADTSGAAPTTQNASLFIGCRNDSALQLNGTIQLLVIYNRALSAAEIACASNWIRSRAAVI